jgi:hypothetical protein
LRFVLWRFCAFLNKESAKTPNATKLFGESPCQKLLAEKVERKKILSSFPSIFVYRVFGRFSA